MFEIWKQMIENYVESQNYIMIILTILSPFAIGGLIVCAFKKILRIIANR